MYVSKRVSHANKATHTALEVLLQGSYLHAVMLVHSRLGSSFEGGAYSIAPKPLKAIS